ncbi:MAG: GNAT family N-acetyltransferase [Pseudomonadota bacterium]
MTSGAARYFGAPAQQALLRRGAALHEITRDLPEYTYYGRTVGLVSPAHAPVGRLIALTRLQGNSNYAIVSPEDIASLQDALTDHDLAPILYARWGGRAAALDRARTVAEQFELPKEYTRVLLTPQTPDAERASLAETALGCGVLPPSLAPLSGETQPGVCQMLLDGQGTVVACAAASGFLSSMHPDHLKTCWWGMLAVDPAHRGKGLSLWLGALALLDMNSRYGFSDFFTGVEPGNLASEAVCTKAGFAREDDFIVGVADPGLVPGGRMTK